MLVLQVYPVYAIGPPSLKRAQLVSQVLNIVVLVFLLTAINGVTYMTNGTMTWPFSFNDVAFSY